MQLFARVLRDSSKLKELLLGHNNIGNEGVRALCEFVDLSELTRLELHSNRIGDVGLMQLTSVRLGTLKVFRLDKNLISYRGASALVRALRVGKLAQIDILEFRANRFSARDLEEIASAFDACVDERLSC